jgi:hypothetical protein
VAGLSRLELVDAGQPASVMASAAVDVYDEA